MKAFVQIAPYLHNPLVLVGFVLLLFFGVHRSLIRSKIIPPVSATAGNRLVQHILRFGFVIALVVIIAGFLLQGLAMYLQRRSAAQNTAEILGGIGRVSAAFEMLDKRGGLISSPSTPEEYYHNARFFQINGNFLAARQAYQEYLKSDLPFIDPLLRYSSLLKAQDGNEAALATFQAISQRSSNPSAHFVYYVMLNHDDRIQKLHEMIQADSNFAPAIYQLSSEYSLRTLGLQTLADKRQERRCLDAFELADGVGGLDRYYLDKDEVEQLRADARARLAALGAATHALDAPLALSAMWSNQGVLLYFQIAEPAKEIFYGIDSDRALQSTGFQTQIDPRTGGRMPEYGADIPRLSGIHRFYIKYVDLRGTTNGPYVLDFDSQRERLKEVKSNLQRDEWASFSYHVGSHVFVYFSLMSYRDVFKSVNYSFDSDDCGIELNFPPSADAWDTNRFNGDNLALEEPPRYICIRVTFVDGSVSETKRISCTREHLIQTAKGSLSDGYARIRDIGSECRLFFEGISDYRLVVVSACYSIDNDNCDLEFGGSMAPRQAATQPDDSLVGSVLIPVGTKFAYVQYVFSDGSKSEKQRIEH